MSYRKLNKNRSVKEIKEIVSNEIDNESSKPKMSKKELNNMLIRIEEEMKEAAKNMDFERAAELRDMIYELQSED